MSDSAPIIFLKIGWMSHYDGREGDQIRGAHRFIQETEGGHEDRNFLSVGGKCYGYAPHNHADRQPSRIKFKERFACTGGAILGDGTDTRVDGVTVVWIARAPSGGVYVVGWYENALLYADRQRLNRRAYYAVAKASNCVVLDVPSRTYMFDNPPRQGAVWYGDGAATIAGVRRFISDRGHGRKAGRSRIEIDTSLRIEIERAAVKATTRAFEARGFVVTSVEKEALGWDLEARAPGETLLLEVKGTAKGAICVEMTPNEYSRRNHVDYRIAIVANALTKPKLLVFQVGTDKKTWRDESGKRRLRFVEIKAARLTVC